MINGVLEQKGGRGGGGGEKGGEISSDKREEQKRELVKWETCIFDVAEIYLSFPNA